MDGEMMGGGMMMACMLATTLFVLIVLVTIIIQTVLQAKMLRELRRIRTNSALATSDAESRL